MSSVKSRISVALATIAKYIERTTGRLMVHREFLVLRQPGHVTLDDHPPEIGDRNVTTSPSDIE